MATNREEYTQEQNESVLRVRQCKDYYEIIGVSKTFTESDLKKQYRKLALQLHPDKNKAPGSAEAFKAVSNAFVVLSDPQKKKQYDLHGPEGEQATTRRRNRFADGDGYYYEYNRGFEDDISPDEIFNMFFGGGFPNGNVYVHRGTRFRNGNRDHGHNHQQEPSGYGVLLQMMPVLVLLSLSLMSSFFVSDPPYSLQRTNKYLYERKTNNLQVNYYVKENFEKEYKKELNRIEAHVEEEYISNLRTSCFREKNYRESMIWKARSYRDSQLEERAKSLRTPSCDRLKKFSIDTFW